MRHLDIALLYHSIVQCCINLLVAKKPLQFLIPIGLSDNRSNLDPVNSSKRAFVYQIFFLKPGRSTDTS